MINHVRTLLLNQNGANNPTSSYFGEEFVSPIFLATTNLPAYVVNIRNTLFGINPDRAMLNYRLKQYMTIIHATELSEFVYDLDSRVTYLSNNSNVFQNTIYGASYTQTNTPVRQLWFLGDKKTLVDSRQLYSSWQVIQTDNSGNNVTIVNLTPPFVTNVVAYTTPNSDGLSSIIPLPYSPLSFRFAENTGSNWVLQTFSRPLFGVSDVVNQLDTVRFNDTDQLFDSNPLVEPYTTFSNLWRYGDELPYRLGGLLLALAYKTNTLIPGIG